MYTYDSAIQLSSGAATASIITSLIVLAVFIFIWFKAAKNMARIAADKGYTERKWFHYCFWLGLAGFIMVCAMPDKSNRQ